MKQPLAHTAGPMKGCALGLGMFASDKATLKEIVTFCDALAVFSESPVCLNKLFYDCSFFFYF